MNLKRSRNTWLTLLAIIGLVVFQYFYPADVELPAPEDAVEAGDVVQAAYAAKRSGVWLETEGQVTRLLSDDNEGSRHQRFIVEVGGGHTVLIAHNIDLAERVPVSQGDTISLRGMFEWNDRGGVIHWTHHDPKGRHKGGWIRRSGELYK
ncbi:MAG: DUF3465 domain-containing protein [Gammaproteobacteria bacterium]|nr:DUF3465 domain-containing protein [Gammaproteobacteria bacterium]NNJ95156.1 DUF3465 domain-containing protein [Halobacteria archaeon]